MGWGALLVNEDDEDEDDEDEATDDDDEDTDDDAVDDNGEDDEMGLFDMAGKPLLSCDRGECSGPLPPVPFRIEVGAPNALAPCGGCSRCGCVRRVCAICW